MGPLRHIRSHKHDRPFIAFSRAQRHVGKQTLPVPKQRCEAASSGKPGSTVTYRQGGRKDGSAIRALIFSQMMNPLGLNPENFTVATTEQGELAGFCQLVEHSDGNVELRSLYVKDTYRNAGIGRTLVQKMIQRASMRTMYLVTPAYRARFYELCGLQSLTPWELPGYMLPDIFLGSIVLAALQRGGIVGMMYEPKKRAELKQPL